MEQSGQQQLLRLVAQGLGAREIAKKLGLAEGEVRSTAARALGELKKQRSG